MLVRGSVCFFFFQAEDGIRDWSVTAVQTCALPISALDLSADPRLHDSAPAKFWRAQALSDLHRWSEALPLYEAVAGEDSALRPDAIFGAADALRRSEERRVGKEWRSRGSTQHQTRA